MGQQTAAYRETLNLPQTVFPMRAQLPQREPARQERWRALGVYQRLRELRRGAPRFVLHDGPPFSNGDIHLGTALNKILKDIVVRYRSLRGFDAPYVPGWDCHGLPTERVALERAGKERKDLDPLDIRRLAHETAMHFQAVQSQQFQRLGLLGDWDHPYLTLDPAYEAAVLGVFQRMVEQGWVYRGLRPVSWCPQCETALAEAEIEYRDATSPSLYLKFAVVQVPASLAARLADAEVDGERLVFVAWTTTPWTLPANVALAVHPDLTYGCFRVAEEGWVVAERLAEATFSETGVSGKLVLTLDGHELVGCEYRHPFLERTGVVVPASHVRADQGTGVVHTAPGHGAEDFWTGQEHNLPVVQPLDERGVFTAEGGQFAGQFCFDADRVLIKELRARGALLHASEVTHAYPHCWRCRGQVIFRATQQWFLDVGQRNEKALRAIEAVDWRPTWGKARIRSMVEERPDWCISRQRAWGVPIPAFFCAGCDAAVLTPETVASVRAIIAREGSDAWWRLPVADLVPEGLACPACGGHEFRTGNDIFDVWFESGSSHAAVLPTRPDLGWPADLYLEGHDQYRGWFQSSLWTGLALEERAPYRTCVGHGFTQDELGRAMHKSLGNVVDPLAVIARHGADVLRLWVTYEDFRNDLVVSEAIFEQVAESYRRLRNTLRFLVANLGDFDPVADRVDFERLPSLDRWALHRLAELGETVTRAYDEYELHRVYYQLHTFAATDLSAFYLDALKDRLYCEASDSPARRAAQTVLETLARHLCLYLAPILPHTSDEAWEQVPRRPDDAECVHLMSWPDCASAWRDAHTADDWQVVQRVREEVHRRLDEAKRTGVVKQPLEAVVTVSARAVTHEVLARHAESLPGVFGVSQVRLRAGEERTNGEAATAAPVAVEIGRARGAKCARCWLWQPEVGAAARHLDLCARCVRVVGTRDEGISSP